MDKQEIIYQKLIIDTARKPKYKGDVTSKAFAAHANNPLCGDEIHLGTNFDGDGLVWQGEGCILCQAAADIFCGMHKTAKKSEIIESAEKIIVDFNQDKQEIDDFFPFQSVKSVPSRIKCVILPAKTALQFK